MKFSQKLTILAIAGILSLSASVASAQLTANRQSMTANPSDYLFDFEVYMAPPVQPVYHLKVRCTNGSWEYARDIVFSPGAETSSFGGKTKWESWYRAYSSGSAMKRRGEVTDFRVVEHWPNPQWQFVGVFDTSEEAQWMAQWIEDFMSFNTKIEYVFDADR